MALKLLIIDDHPLFREGVGTALKSLDHDIRLVLAADAEEGFAAAGEHPDLDLVMLDLALPGMNGFVAIREFRLRFPLLPVVVVSALENAPNARRALAEGAAGFIPKSSPTQTVVEALREVLGGGAYLPPILRANGIAGEAPLETASVPAAADIGLLTVRQIEVLTHMCRGKGNKEIASDFGLSEKTVKTHVAAIFKAFGVVNRTQAVLAAKRVGLLTD
jgi:two-component system nitrate/nitrite response regulator NarL